MSVPTFRQAFAFLAPLKGKASVFIAPGRRGNTSAAHFILGCLAATKTRTVIFDTSSFYGSNIRILTESLPKDFLQRSTLVAPQEGRMLEDSLAQLLLVRAEAIVIDDLNALHYLMSSDRQGSGIHRLFTFLRLLAYETRINRTYAFVTVYKAATDSASGKATRRSLAAAADLQISTDDQFNRITFKCSDIKDWPNNRFGAPRYLELNT